VTLTVCNESAVVLLVLILTQCHVADCVQYSKPVPHWCGFYKGCRKNNKSTCWSTTRENSRILLRPRRAAVSAHIWCPVFWHSHLQSWRYLFL